MALTATRFDYRISLSNLDRGVTYSGSLVAAQHPSETVERLTLRVLAWCLLWEERLELGPGLSTRDSADVWAHDLTGRVTTWIECGTANAEELRKVMQQNSPLAAHAVFSSAQRRDAFLKEVEQWAKLPRGSTLTVWLVDTELMAELVRRNQKRQTWTVTIVGDSFYIDVDGATVSGGIESVQVER